MSIPVVMPQLGLTMEEGTVSAWLKKTGDTVKKNDLLFSVSTDKVEMEVESVAEGVLGEIIEPAGSTVPVGTVLAYIEASGEDGAAANSPASKKKPAPGGIQESPALREDHAAAHLPSNTDDDGRDSGNAAAPRRQVSPRAKRLAKELGIDLAEVVAVTPDGQITEADVRAAASRQEKTFRTDGNRRQLIAERLTRSVQTIPAFSVAAEVNAEKLVALSESLKASLGRAAGVKLTITDLLLGIFARALKSSPEVNATWEADGVRANSSVDIGLAVATAKGVVAPVIRGVDTLDLPALAARRAELAEKARLGRLSLGDLEGGVATLSNLGMYRVDHFQAIINPGQSSILAVGQIRERPWVDKTLTIKPTLVLNLTVDHRVADGAAAAVFLNKMIEFIEDPLDLPWKPDSFPGDGAGRRSNG